MRSKSLFWSWKLTGLVALAGIAIAFVYLNDSRNDVTPSKSSPKASPENFRLPTQPDKPEIEVTPDHQLARVQHKDAHGLSPLETVHTDQGVITIKRTFDLGGKLLKEEAYLDGKAVPVPKR